MVPEPFSLTYIVYDKDDGLFGWIMALMSLAPVVFVIVICSSILVHRDIHSCFLLVEMVSCTVLNQILKRIFRQERPGGVQGTHGMPSDHSQFMSCLCIYLTLWIFNRVHLRAFSQNVIAVAILWIVWFLVVYGRIYLGEHSLPQVLVGVCVGLAYGLFWYYLDITDYSNVIDPLERERELCDSKKD
ncbi:dolichyldiphosphatase [Blastocystis sp. subtype 4]|uniref:dolichyldiphosphatase n=1 Tax=Blastocystis sp. subtype 4 TaxID=944170 RepID=UPI000711CA19|nr:dolichyldiphosphatase [Blastocystis sp. subtype 4]KNB46442.1 dolichyldiphosphatase [Blastocystis sp. subtype 4]|eukprot:XP_014529885.1 dolichyldiphosphatase [Blastocystis sp. subtype 4]